MKHHNELSQKLVAAGYNAFVAHCALIAAKGRCTAAYNRWGNAENNIGDPSLYPINIDSQKEIVLKLELQYQHEKALHEKSIISLEGALAEYSILLASFNVDDHEDYPLMQAADKTHIKQLRDDYFYAYTLPRAKSEALK